MDQYVVSGNTEQEFYFYYDVKDVTGAATLSSYALSIAPLTFIPETGEDWATEFSNKRIVWDFGDGTKVETVTARHTYTKPGQYRVRSYVYDNLGESYRNSRSVVINVRDIVEDKLMLETDTSICGIDHLTSEVTSPIQVTQYNSKRSIENYGSIPPVVTHIEPKSFTRDFGYYSTNLNSATYGHLIPTYKFLQDIDGVEAVPISAIQVNNYTNIYAYVSGNEFLTSTKQVAGSEFAGISSSNTLYFVSDIPGLYNLSFGFEQESIFSSTNTTTYGTSARICDNIAWDHLKITSNGIDGENTPIDTFNISPVKFSCTKIPFVVQIKDTENYSQRALPLLEADPLLGDCIKTESLSSTIIGESFEYYLNTEGSAHIPLKLRLTDKYNTTYPAQFGTNFSDLSSILVPGYFPGYAGGFFKGYVIIETDKVLNDVWIEAITTDEVFALSGISNTFSIYPKDHYVVAKQGEDINFKTVFEDVTTQPLFTETKILINDFLTSIFGDLDSAQDSIGKSTYEKIQNFVDNNSVIDYANIDQLASILKSYGLPKINTYTTPPRVKRLLNLLSISMSRLFGDINQNTEDYNSYTYPDNTCYGANRCDPIPENGVVFAGYDIVAFEVFSGKWLTLNTMLPLCASSPPEAQSWAIDPVTDIDYSRCFKFGDCNPLITESTISAVRVESDYFNVCLEGEYDDKGVFSPYTKYYQLSDFNDTWGWPLIKDKDGTLFDVYKFYYKTTNNDLNNPQGSVINFEDKNTTIESEYTYKEWTKPFGAMSHIFANSLYDGLGLFTCADAGETFIYLRPDGTEWYIRYYNTNQSCYVEANPPADNSIYIRPFI